jgi:hypothetical protein
MQAHKLPTKTSSAGICTSRTWAAVDRAYHGGQNHHYVAPAGAGTRVCRHTAGFWPGPMQTQRFFWNGVTRRPEMALNEHREDDDS